MKQQAQFWYVWAEIGTKSVALGVAAFTERSARMQARKRLGHEAVIVSVEPVEYAHAWVLDLTA